MAIATLALASALLASRAPARTWSIRADGSGDAPTIQAGIDSAAAGDTVLVGAGTYDENLDMRGKALTLLSESGPGGTIVDGGARGRVLAMTSGTVIGFTLRNGLDEYTGGGILIEGPGSSLVRDNVIEYNTAGIDYDIGDGAGIYLDPPTNGVLVERNVIRNNIAHASGGGIWDNGGFVTRNEFRNNTIAFNRSKNGGAGAAIFSSIFAGNLVYGNSCLYEGGGLAIRLEGHAIVTGNTILGNRTQNGTRVNGAGIQNGGSSVISSNIVADNHSAMGRGAGITSYGPPRPICNDIWDNDIDGVFGSDTTGTRNFGADPQFCAVDPVTSGNFTLQVDSPCAGSSGTCGLIGAAPVGCGTVLVSSRPWTGVKLLYR